jgi:glutaredoxin
MYVIISRDQCEFCDKAKALLKANGKQFIEYNVQTVSSRWLVPLLLKAGLKTVPQVFDPSGKHIGGYDKLKAVFEEG